MSGAVRLDSQKLSAPLHELVDTVFQLQSRGWLRRHIIELARQVCSPSPHGLTNPA